ncbi:hypothetical protein GCM10022284_73820 [Streptomyces hundungensis]
MREFAGAGVPESRVGATGSAARGGEAADAGPLPVGSASSTLPGRSDPPQCRGHGMDVKLSQPYPGQSHAGFRSAALPQVGLW